MFRMLFAGYVGLALFAVATSAVKTSTGNSGCHATTLASMSDTDCARNASGCYSENATGLASVSKSSASPCCSGGSCPMSAATMNSSELASTSKSCCSAGSACECKDAAEADAEGTVLASMAISTADVDVDAEASSCECGKCDEGCGCCDAEDCSCEGCACEGCKDKS